ncbi:hypothetical protein GCM10010430_51390 [Kitasatospora cystarginea]|uniref:Peptidoglycan recognition protein family domain-containing protein n=1 Tax=Kitasatospora cystarginea TaxID=58350 RepID=A0ABN3EKL9_9ACTN
MARSLWQPGQAPSPPEPQHDHTVRALFIHHTANGDSYDPKDVPEIVRSIYRDHRTRRGWDDIGYHFLVDRYGVIYEGRLSGVDQAVTGAHTQGFNHETVGVAAIGTFPAGAHVPPAVLEAIARLAAWQLGAYGVDPRTRVELTSTNSESRFPAGTRHPFNAISGHRDACFTECPGVTLYALLPQIIEHTADLLRGATPSRTGLPIGSLSTPGPAARG